MNTSTTNETTGDGKPSAPDLPVGTNPEHLRMHNWIKRFLIICTVGLVIEGSFTMPFLAVWYGWPTLSMREICDEMMKIRYANDTVQCEYPAPFPGPPFGGQPEAANIDTAKDHWGVQPKPMLPRIGFRELVRIHDERIARQHAAQQNASAPHP
jgi:hypothetical protein